MSGRGIGDAGLKHYLFYSGEIECNLVDTGAIQRVPLSNVCSSTPPMISYVAAQALHCTLVDLQVC